MNIMVQYMNIHPSKDSMDEEFFISCGPEDGASRLLQKPEHLATTQ
jgi:hypothetical protein